MQINHTKREKVCGSRNVWPANVYKEILGSFVNVEDLVPEQTETGTALKSQLPQTESRRVTVQSRMTQDEPD